MQKNLNYDFYYEYFKTCVVFPAQRNNVDTTVIQFDFKQAYDKVKQKKLYEALENFNKDEITQQ